MEYPSLLPSSSPPSSLPPSLPPSLLPPSPPPPLLLLPPLLLPPSSPLLPHDSCTHYHYKRFTLLQHMNTAVSLEEDVLVATQNGGGATVSMLSPAGSPTSPGSPGSLAVSAMDDTNLSPGERQKAELFENAGAGGAGGRGIGAEGGSVNTMDRKNIHGSPTEVAVFHASLLHCQGAYNPPGGGYRRYPKVFEVPFNSANKYMITVHEVARAEKKSYCVTVKGAPDKIFP